MIEYMKTVYYNFVAKAKEFDGGVELGGIMFNVLFFDLMLVNFYKGNKNYPLFHFQVMTSNEKKTTLVFELLFFIKFSIVREVVE